MPQSKTGRYFSFVLRIEEGQSGSIFNGQIVLADGQKVGLAEGSYRVRVWLEPEGEIVRGMIHHEQTDQQIRFQSGDRVAEFIRACLKHQPDDVGLNG